MMILDDSVKPWVMLTNNIKVMYFYNICTWQTLDDKDVIFCWAAARDPEISL